MKLITFHNFSVTCLTCGHVKCVIINLDLDLLNDTNNVILYGRDRAILIDVL